MMKKMMMKKKPKNKIVTWEIYETDMKEIKKVLEYLVTLKENSKASMDKIAPPENNSNHTQPQSNPEVEQVSEPMVFNILRKPATDVVTIKCRINKLSI